MTTQTSESQELQESGAQHPEVADGNNPRRAYIPRSDVYETDQAIVVVAEMPGVDESNVDITLEKNVLTITGKVGNENPEGYRAILSEYGSGDFERRFALSQTVDRENISATVKNGILTLTLSKAKEAQPRRIAVKSG